MELGQRPDETRHRVAKLAADLRGFEAEDAGDIVDRSDLRDDAELVCEAEDRTAVRHAHVRSDDFGHQVDVAHGGLGVRGDHRLVVLHRSGFRQCAQYENNVHGGVTTP